MVKVTQLTRLNTKILEYCYNWILPTANLLPHAKCVIFKRLEVGCFI